MKLTKKQREVLKRMATGAYIEGALDARPILREGGAIESIAWQIARGLLSKELIVAGHFGSAMLYSLTPAGREEAERG